MVNGMKLPEAGSSSDPLSAEPVLAALGVSAVEERVYRALLTRPGATVAEIESGSGVGSKLRQILSELEGKGLVSSTAGKPLRFLPAPPHLAVEGLIHRRRNELERARIAAQQMVEDFRNLQMTDPPIEIVEVIGGEEALHERFVQLQTSALEEVVLLDKPPYADPLGINEFEIDTLERGVAYRVIYDRRALEMPGQMDWLKVHTEAGEDARVLDDVPIKLAIADRKLGLVPLSGEEALAGALLIHHSSLLDALSALFETLWNRAVPLRTAVVPTSDKVSQQLDVDQRLITLMAAGLKDEAIARQLGLGVRTVRRRMTHLMEKLGARTRFQAGLQAGRKGWL